MEKKIENAIDNMLESIGPQLHMFSIGLGVALIIVGLIVFLNKGLSSKINNIGLIVGLIGIVSVISGYLQL